ncbi:MAG: SDR family oxidoreductase [Candidatus Omnitrophica bacterium]|nr:SDR family oxidoreductase [Candidatus Omnitrophota bacterium]
MKNRKVLIAGGAGFIGSHLCDYYVSKGNRVVCLDNLATGAKANIEHLISSSSFTFVNADVVRLKEISLDGDFDMVFNLASPASPPDYFRLPVETLRVNSLGTENLLELARRCDAKFLFASTSEVYGDPLIPVQKEEYWGNVNSIGPRSVYDEAKRYGEAMVMAYFRKYNVDTRIVRIFNTYGPRMRLKDGRVIPNFIAQLLEKKPLTVYGDGKQTRSFCYVDDLVAGLAGIMEKDYHLPVNLGNPGEFTILELAEIIQKIAGMKTEIEFLPPLEDDPRRRKPDITRAKELMGWQPSVPLEEGLKKTLDYFKKSM